MDIRRLKIINTSRIYSYNSISNSIKYQRNRIFEKFFKFKELWLNSFTQFFSFRTSLNVNWYFEKYSKKFFYESWNQCTTNSLQSFKKNLKKSGSFTISLTYITVSPVENLFLWETIRDRELAWWKLFADRKLLSKTVLRHFLPHFIDRQHSLWTETRERRGDFFGNY